MSIVLLVLGLLLFIGLVILHEFGHFIVARRGGVEVEEFGIGFPPRAWARKTKKGFLFTLNWLPIGGFVKLKGENDSATEAGSFGASSFKTKGKIMLAGVAMNLLAAFVIFTILGWVGMPRLLDNQYHIASDTQIAHREVLVGLIEPHTPAATSGLRTRDRLVAINAIQISSADQLPQLTKRFAGTSASITYMRGGQQHVAYATLRSAAQAKNGAYLGLSPAEFALTRSTWSAPLQALGLMKQFTIATFQGLGTAINAVFHGDGAKASEQVSGPVGIVVVLHDGSLLGYQFVLLIVGLISLSLAIMNVLPIPALDGGRFYVLVLSRVFGKRLSKDMEERIVGASFVFLLGLIVVITIVDVRRFF